MLEHSAYENTKRFGLSTEYTEAGTNSQRKISRETRMWANAQRDGRPAEYRWRPPFNAAKFGWRPILVLTTECRAVTLPRRKTR